MNIKKMIVLLATSSVVLPVVYADIQQGKIDPKASEQWFPEPSIVAVDPVPSDAIILFDGSSTHQWKNNKGEPISWVVDGNVLTVQPSTGSIHTVEKFCDVQLHLEWKSPPKVLSGDSSKPAQNGQNAGNSGVYLMGRYEVQILDSYQNKTYVNGQAASIYKQSAPLVNVTKPTGQWNEYDIIFTAPRFEGQRLISPAKMTVLHNGVLVQNDFTLKGATAYDTWPSYHAHGCAPILLQDHSDKVSFRNIWVRKL